MTVGIFRNELPERVVEIVQRAACAPPNSTATNPPRMPVESGPEFPQ